ncbi:MAG: DUF2806 domain-containing protein [Pseudomonadales bacterium]|nr:DUF2806 domain-containing protein [Pseudomonadales bacterium]
MTFEIKDLAGLSQPLTRLIEVISAGIGNISGPYLLKSNARAKAEEIKLLTDALEKSNLRQLGFQIESQSPQLTIGTKTEKLELTKLQDIDRIRSRIEHQLRSEQENIESITSESALELAKISDVPEETPELEWISRFFSIAEEVSSEDMQVIWGKILAGEIKQPGAFSLCTLEVLRNLSRTEANLFNNVSNFTFRNGSLREGIIPTVFNSEMQSCGISFGEFTKLVDCGLIYPNEMTKVFFDGAELGETGIFESSGHSIVFKSTETSVAFELENWRLTNAGTELLSLTENNPKISFLQMLKSDIKSFGLDCSIVKNLVRTTDSFTAEIVE